MLLPTLKSSETYSVGLDISLTGTGVYFWGMSNAIIDYYYEIDTDAKARDLDREFVVFNNIAEDLICLPVSIVCMEHYGPIGKFAGKITQRAEICGMLKHFILNTLGVDLILIGPKSLKKFATGNGNAKKGEMIQAAASQYQLFVDSDNQADASHLGHFGHHILSGHKSGVDFERYNSDHK